MKDLQRAFIVPLLLILIALLLVGGGTYVYTQTKQTTQSVTGNVILPQATSTQQNQSRAVSQTANWKTYTLNKFGLSFKYPPKISDIVIQPKKTPPAADDASSTEYVSILEKDTSTGNPDSPVIYNRLILDVSNWSSKNIEQVRKSNEMRKIDTGNRDLEAYEVTIKNEMLNVGDHKTYNIYDIKRNLVIQIVASYFIGYNAPSPDQIAYLKNVYEESLKTIVPIIENIKNTNNVVYPAESGVNSGGTI